MTNVIDYFGTGNDSQHSFLSNFFYYDHGVTTEHLYQAAKTNDPEWAAKILDAPSPKIAKQLGRRAPMRGGWDEHRVPVMRALLGVKFAHPESALGEKLLATGDAELIEGNWWGDTFWGRCNGKGSNFLGKLLMERRSILSAMEALTKAPLTAPVG